MELVTFDNQDEYDLIMESIDPAQPYWIGYRDDVQGVLTSVTGKTEFFTNMQDGWDKPPDVNEKCIM